MCMMMLDDWSGLWFFYVMGHKVITGLELMPDGQIKHYYEWLLTPAERERFINTRGNK